MRINAIECFVDWANKSNQIVSTLSTSSAEYPNIGNKYCYVIEVEWILACVGWVKKCIAIGGHISLKARLVFGAAWAIYLVVVNCDRLQLSLLHKSGTFNCFDVIQCLTSSTAISSKRIVKYIEQISGPKPMTNSLFRVEICLFIATCYAVFCFEYFIFVRARIASVFVFGRPLAMFFRFYFIVLKTEVVFLVIHLKGICSLNRLIYRG